MNVVRKSGCGVILDVGRLSSRGDGRTNRQVNGVISVYFIGYMPNKGGQVLLSDLTFTDSKVFT